MQETTKLTTLEAELALKQSQIDFIKDTDYNAIEELNTFEGDLLTIINKTSKKTGLSRNNGAVLMNTIDKQRLNKFLRMIQEEQITSKKITYQEAYDKLLKVKPTIEHKFKVRGESKTVDEEPTRKFGGGGMMTIDNLKASEPKAELSTSQLFGDR